MLSSLFLLGLMKVGPRIWLYEWWETTLDGGRSLSNGDVVMVFGRHGEYEKDESEILRFNVFKLTNDTDLDPETVELPVSTDKKPAYVDSQGNVVIFTSKGIYHYPEGKFIDGDFSKPYNNYFFTRGSNEDDLFVALFANSTELEVFDSDGNSLLKVNANDIKVPDMVVYESNVYVSMAVDTNSSDGVSPDSLLFVSTAGDNWTYYFGMEVNSTYVNKDEYGVVAAGLAKNSTQEIYLVSSSTIGWQKWVWDNVTDFPSGYDVAWASAAPLENGVVFPVWQDTDGDVLYEKVGYVYSTSTSRGSFTVFKDYTSLESQGYDCMAALAIVPGSPVGGDAVYLYFSKIYQQSGSTYADYSFEIYKFLPGGSDSEKLASVEFQKASRDGYWKTGDVLYINSDGDSLIYVFEYNSTGYGFPYDKMGYYILKEGRHYTFSEDMREPDKDGEFDIITYSALESDDGKYAVFPVIDWNQDGDMYLMIYRGFSLELNSAMGDGFVSVVGNLFKPGTSTPMKLYIKAQASGDITYRVYSFDGEVHYEGKIPNAVKGQIYTVEWTPPEDMGPGLYIFRVYSGGKAQSAKFLIIK